MILTLAGGVGAARFLTGLLQVERPADCTAVVNIGDDVELHGLWVSPDLDTVTYTLAGAIDPERGWGLAGETWHAMEALGRYGGITWFNLGDRDLATHLYRTQRRREGATLSEVTAEITAAWGLGLRVLPVSDDRVETRVELGEMAGTELGEMAGTELGEMAGTELGEMAGTEVNFQEYFVKHRHGVPVRAVRFVGVEAARPASGVLEAIAQADTIVVAPSNPLVSIAPVLAIPGVRAAVAARRERTVAVSPIVGGAALKGPADRMLVELGHRSDVVGVAQLYRDFASVLVVDTVDAPLAGEVEAAGMRCVVTDTVMKSPALAAALARTTLEVFT
jgi:LPPG:FO 2-phospho-L-lactate transferase